MMFQKNRMRSLMAVTLLFTLPTASLRVLAEPGEVDVAQGTVIIDAAAITAARAAGSPAFDKSRSDPAYVFEALYRGDYLRGTEGAAKSKDAYMGNLNLMLTVNGEKAFDLPGSTVFAHVMHNHGGQINEHVGTQQGVDNIEVPASSAKLSQLWWQQELLDQSLSVLGGLYDLNSEFYVTESSGVFIHPSFGIGAEVAQTGASLFPTTGLGLRVRGELNDQLYGQVVVLDAVPGNPNKSKGTHVRLSSKEGALWVGELGWRLGDASDAEKAVTKVSVGLWRYSKKQDDQTEVDVNGDPTRRTNNGFYILGEQELLRHDDGRRLMGFVRYGAADEDVNAIKDDLMAGVTLEGPFAGRPDDILGFGVSRVRMSQKSQDNQVSAGEQVIKSETAYELTYQARINEWLSIQPEVQYVKTSASDPARDNDLIVGVRFELAMSW